MDRVDLCAAKRADQSGGRQVPGRCGRGGYLGQDKTWKNKARTAILFQNYTVNMDCITMCGWANCPPFFTQYKSVSPDYMGDPALGAKVYSAITGISMTNEQMLDAMNPIFNLERAIHVREGRRREHDMFNDGVFKLDAWKWTSKEEFVKALDEYCNDPARGWDPKTGIPGALPWRNRG